MRCVRKVSEWLVVTVMLVMVGCSGGGGGGRSLVAVQVTPSSPVLAKGTSQQLKATGIYSDNTNDDISSLVTWRSSDPAVAAVMPTGVSIATGVGSAVISASLGAVEGSQTIRVSPAELASVEITPPPDTPTGTSRQFTAIGHFTDQTTQDLSRSVTWISSSDAVATVSNAAGSEGLASFIRPGSVQVSARYATLSGAVVSGSVEVTVSDATLVSIQITPVKPKVAAGTRIQLTAMGVYSDHTVQNLTASCTWQSSAWDKAEVSNGPGLKGQVIAYSPGVATIQAIFISPDGDRFEAGATVEVTAALLRTIQVRPSLPVVGVMSPAQLTATGIFSDDTSQDLTNLVTWYSGDEKIAVVSNAAGSKGLAKGLSAGAAVVRAVFNDVSGTTEITVPAADIARIEITVVNPYAPFTPLPPVTLVGARIQLRATAVFSDNSIQDVTAAATWESSDSSVAVAANSPKGELTGLGAGAASIRATFGGTSGITVFTVRSVDDIIEFSVMPPTAAVAVNTVQSMRATALLSDLSVVDVTTTCTWESEDDSVAVPGNAIGGKGVFTAVSAGNTTVRAVFGGKTGAATLRVTSATLVRIQITPAAPVMAPGSNLQFTATGVFSDDTTQNITTAVTWHSSDDTQVAVSNLAGFKGLAVAVGGGTVSIRASLFGITGDTPVTVTSADLVAIKVTPAVQTVATGTKLQFTATGIFADASTVDLSTSATWHVSEPTIAFISNSRGRKGLVKGLNAGTSAVQAVFAGVSGVTTAVVTPADLVSIEVTPVQPVLVRGVPVQFTANGIFSDGTVQNLTNDVTWRTSDAESLAVSNVPGTKGQAYPLDRTTAAISATYKDYPADGAE